MDNVVEEIKKIIEDIADVPSEEIDEDSALLEELDLSSFEIMSIMAEVARTYSVDIPESEMLSISTVKELAEVVNSKRK